MEQHVCIKALMAKQIESCSNKKIKFDDAFRGLCVRQDDRDTATYKAISILKGKGATWEDNIFDYLMQMLELPTAPQPYNGDIRTKLEVRLENRKFAIDYYDFQKRFERWYKANKATIDSYIESCVRTLGRFEFRTDNLNWYC